MNDVRILVVDDEEKWRTSLPDLLLKRLDPRLKIEIANDYATAVQKVKSNSYDLVSLDLDLLGDINPAVNPDFQGMDLLKECRESTRNLTCGLLVLSGRATPSIVYRALEKYEINVFMDKHDFADGEPYLTAVKDAIRRSRLQQSERQLNDRYQLTLTYDQNGLVRGDLVGPDHRSEVLVNSHSSFTELEDLARRADDLNQRLNSREKGAWRPEARSIGTAMYGTLISQQQISSLLSTARTLVAGKSSGSLGLQFNGPPYCLSVPYELIRDDDYLALTYLLTRRLSQGPRFTIKSQPFFKFIENQVEKDEPLRILLVGANVDDGLPAIESEVLQLVDSISSDLKLLGVSHQITTLLGGDVTYRKLSEALLEGQHIFHFAGHGNFDESLPERSPLALQDRELTASDLQLLTQGTELRFVFLSCCLAARTARQVGRGDFHGFLHALSQADVPAALAYRWEVEDGSALELAESFYRSLWRNLSFSQALLNSRRKLAMGPNGRDNETWAAPVLVSQAS